MKSLFKTLGLCLLSWHCLAQNVTITPNGITPSDASSIPTLTYDAIEALPSPSFGAMANDVTFKCLRYYNGTKWVQLMSNYDLKIPAVTAKVEGGNMGEESHDIAVDANGNIYITGKFEGTSTFGNITLISDGQTDAFLAKYSKNGILLWVKKIGGQFTETADCITVDANGNVYVGGTFNGSANFEGTTLTSKGSYDIFIMKYTSNGSFEWVQQVGGTKEDDVRDVVIDTSGNVYITGGFMETVAFGNNSVTSTGAKDIYIAQCTNAGVFQWVRKAGGVGQDYAFSMAIDVTENIYLTGTMNGTTTFGNIEVAGSYGGYDVFIAKYNSLNSTWEWVKRAGGSGEDYGGGLVIDKSGNLLITGGFNGTANFSNYIITSAGKSDIFVAKYDGNGSPKWVKNAGGTGEDYGYGVGVDANGNVYITGIFFGAADFENTHLQGMGSLEIFYTKYKTDGSLEWAKSAGSTDNDYSMSIAVEPDGNAYLTGYLTGNAVFGNVHLTINGYKDLFIARIRD